MAEASQRRTLHCRCLSIRIDFDHVAERSRLVAIVFTGLALAGRDIETHKFLVLLAVAGRRLPTIAPAIGRHPQTSIVAETFASVDEDFRPVFLTGQISAPGRIAIGAIVVGAARSGTVDGVACPDIVATRDRSGQHDRRGGGDTAVVGRIDHVRPATIVLALDLDDRDPVGVDLGTHFVGRPHTVRLGRAASRRP